MTQFSVRWILSLNRLSQNSGQVQNPKDGTGIQMVTRMDALFLVDREARKQQLSVEGRLALRREHAESWAEEIRQEYTALSKTALPKSALSTRPAFRFATLRFIVLKQKCALEPCGTIAA